MVHDPPRFAPRRTHVWSSCVFLACATVIFYSCSKARPLLCEAPVRSDDDLDENPSGVYGDSYNYPTFKYLNSWFSRRGTSTHGDPAKGLLRHDEFSMLALEPCEEHIISASMAERDSNGDDLPNGLHWAAWGIVDGHDGPYTAAVVRALLLDYTVDELFLQAGISSQSPYRDSRDIFRNRPLRDINQAMRDAFQRLDNDLLKKAARAINGSRPLMASMTDLAAAEAGCSALLATYDTVSQYLFVASVGNTRAVLGHRNGQGIWEARALSVDHTCRNEDEVARLRVEHPNESDMIKDGRLLGSAVTRAFGDLKWKISARLQTIAQSRFFGQPLLPSLLTPPYITAEPSVSATKIDPNDNDFVILASNGLWDHLTSEQAVRLVGRWLARNDPSIPFREDGGADSLDLSLAASDDDPLRYQESLRQGLLVREPKDLPAPGRDYTKVKYGDEKNWVVVDDNAATHLARNALGGADDDLFCALCAPVEAETYPVSRLRCVRVYPMRRIYYTTPDLRSQDDDWLTQGNRDDITIQVIFFGHGDQTTLDLKLNDDNPDSSDTLDFS
ncbi:MAG: hypothetical protein Q9169_005653 [Polycauliona sp. 2 TL-2023]